MKLVWGSQAAVVALVAEEIGCRADFGECQTAFVVSGSGEVAAGLIFHEWDPDSEVMMVTAAAWDPRWATRGVLREAFGYVFRHAQLCVARTHEDNNTVRRLWKAFGAQEFIIPRLRGREASEAILTLTDDAWNASRFMRSDNGKT